MPDWLEYLRTGLSRAGLHPARREEIVRELAAHLEDEYAALRTRLSHEQAGQTVFSLVPSMETLGHEIRRAQEEDPMNQRTRTLWIPGVTVLLFSSLLLRLLYGLGTWSKVYWFADGPRIGLVLYPWWLMCLPLFGAAGAYFALRAGASPSGRILAGTFPALAVGAFLFFFFLLLAPFADPQVPFHFKIMGLALYTFQWVIIPGAALFLGALPFLFSRSKPEATRA